MVHQSCFVLVDLQFIRSLRTMECHSVAWTTERFTSAPLAVRASTTAVADRLIGPAASPIVPDIPCFTLSMEGLVILISLSNCSYRLEFVIYRRLSKRLIIILFSFVHFLWANICKISPIAMGLSNSVSVCLLKIVCISNILAKITNVKNAFVDFDIYHRMV